MKGWSDCYMAKSTRFRSLHSNSRGLMTFSGFNRNFMHMKHINVSKTPTHEKQKHINIFFKKKKENDDEFDFQESQNGYCNSFPD